MERTLRQTVVIGPGGRFEGSAPGFAPGTEAEIILIFPDEPQAGPQVSREELLKRMWELSDKAIAEGMGTWDIDQTNAEVHAIRYGDREGY